MFNLTYDNRTICWRNILARLPDIQESMRGVTQEDLDGDAKLIYEDCGIAVSIIMPTADFEFETEEDMTIFMMKYL